MKTLIKSTCGQTIMGMICIMVMLSGCAKDSDLNSETNPILDNSLTKSAGIITPEEIESLMFMVEEEKLAGDVYLKMSELYSLKIFDKILQSELIHVSAVSGLIEKYGLENPITGNPPGVFENEELQKLYEGLVNLGSFSKKEAINVGVIIEEKDLKDIQAYLDHVVERKDIEQVYTNLLNGSENHLESFLSEQE